MTLMLESECDTLHSERLFLVIDIHRTLVRPNLSRTQLLCSDYPVKTHEKDVTVPKFMNVYS